MGGNQVSQCFRGFRDRKSLAQSLEVLKAIQDKGHTAIRTKELSRLHRERLLDHGFIKEVIQGWYIIVPPDEQKGDR